MKICLVNNTYPPFSRGGADRIAALMAEGFLARRHDVVVIAGKPYSSDYQETGKYFLRTFFYDLSGMSVIRRGLYVFADLFGVFNYFRVKKILRKEKIDLLITHNLRGLGFWIPLAAKHLRIKHVHVLHDIQLLHPSGLMFYGQEKSLVSLLARVYQFLVKVLFGSPLLVISPSRWLLQQHEQFGYFSKACKEVLPNPVALSTAAEKKFSSDCFTFIFVGEIVQHKGVFLLLDAFKRLCERNQNVCLRIIGKGAVGDDFAAMDRVSFLGWLSSADVRKEMTSADCLVMPSFCYENSPTVIFEAANAGLPALVADIGGAGESARLFNDFLFTPGDASELLARMEVIVQQWQQLPAIGKTAAEKVKKYSLESYIDKVEQLLEAIN